MKPFLLVFLLFAGPAQAVDYMKCEAMQRALERTFASASTDIDKSFAAIIAPKCGKRPDKALIITLGELSYLQEDSKWLNCSQEAMKGANLGKERKRIEAKWQPKLNKINADIKKAGCP
jgi:hypothetical protein